MEAIFEYLIKASAGIALFYLLYWFFLRKETFFGANRWFMLLALGAAVLLPLFPVQYTVFVEQNSNAGSIKTISDTFRSIPVFSVEQTTGVTLSWTQAILLIYITGAVLFLLRLLLQTIVLVHLIIKYRIKSLNGVSIVENEKYGLPFSFFNIVFINPKIHTQVNLPDILAHEKVHIRENHWFDLLFIELLTVIFWFNPFIWFFERSIKQNHEYLADRGVLAQGHTVGNYQALLVNQLMGMQIIGITNNLNFALSTNRLKMMTKKKTPRFFGIKFAWALPALALLLFAFAEPSYRTKNSTPRGRDDAKAVVAKEKTVSLAGYVMDENGKPLPGTSIVIKGTSTGTVADMKGQFKLEVPENASLVLSFVGKKTLTDTYEGIFFSAKSSQGAFHKKYIMTDVVIPIYNPSYSHEQQAPPPPPKAEKPVKSIDLPPPPAGSEKGEKEVFYIVEDMPKYPGGYEAMTEYIEKMQKKIAVSKKVKGKAQLAFTIDAKGKVTDIKVVEKDNDGAAKGAYMIAKNMEDWTPGKQRGKGVPVKYLLPVEFK